MYSCHGSQFTISLSLFTCYVSQLTVFQDRRKKFTKNGRCPSLFSKVRRKHLINSMFRRYSKTPE